MNLKEKIDKWVDFIDSKKKTKIQKKENIQLHLITMKIGKKSFLNLK